MGADGVNRIFEVSVLLQGKAALEDTVNIDTTVQEKNITYPTDGKLAIKIINRLNKLAKAFCVQQRRTYSQEVKGLRLSLRHFRHVKRRGKAKKALKRLRTIAHALLCPWVDPGVTPDLAQGRAVRALSEGLPVLRTRARTTAAGFGQDLFLT